MSSTRPSSSTPLSPTVWFHFINKYPAYWRQRRPWEIILLPLSLLGTGNRGDREEEQRQQRLGRWSLNILLIAFLPSQLCPSCEENKDYHYQCALLAWDRTIKYPKLLSLVIYFFLKWGVGGNGEKSVLEAEGVNTIGLCVPHMELKKSMSKMLSPWWNEGVGSSIQGEKTKTVLPLE